MLAGVINVRRAVLLFCAVLVLASGASGQAVEGGGQASDRRENKEVRSVDHYLDRILERVGAAADAAGVINGADPYRREAEQMLKAGRRDEARALLTRAGEAVAEAAPAGDEKRNDPLLREYIRQVNAQLAALDETASVPLPAAADVAQLPAGGYAANPRVAAFLDYFRSRGRERLEIGRRRLAQYRPMMARVLREEGVPEWLLAVAFVESTYNPAAHSPAQAHGIWQFIPGTGDQYGLRRTAWADERGDPEKSTRAAARYLRDLHAQFGDWLLALAGYNWGGGRVANAIRRTGTHDYWAISSRGLMPAETSNYVPAILAAAQLLGLTEGGRGATGVAGRSLTPSAEADQPAAEGLDELAFPPDEGAEDGGPAVDLSAEEKLARAAARYNVPASEIRQTQPGYYDIPQFRNGRRTGYVRVRIR